MRWACYAAVLLSVLVPACATDAATTTFTCEHEWTSNCPGILTIGAEVARAGRSGGTRPVVVLLTGPDRTGDEGTAVRTMLNHRSRVLTFEPGCRAALASPSVDRPFARVTAAELEGLLERAGVDPPYVLLAHPAAEYYACNFAGRDPENIARFAVLLTLDEPAAILLSSGTRHPFAAPSPGRISER
jgi:hypothetical protein